MKGDKKSMYRECIKDNKIIYRKDLAEFWMISESEAKKTLEALIGIGVIKIDKNGKVLCKAPY